MRLRTWPKMRDKRKKNSLSDLAPHILDTTQRISRCAGGGPSAHLDGSSGIPRCAEGGPSAQLDAVSETAKCAEGGGSGYLDR